MTHSIVELRPVIPVYFERFVGDSSPPDQSKALEDSEWKIIRDLTGLLDPLKVVAQLLEGDQYPTSNLVLPSLAFLFKSYTNPIEKFELRSLSDHKSKIQRTIAEMCPEAAVFRDVLVRNTQQISHQLTPLVDGSDEVSVLQEGVPVGLLRCRCTCRPVRPYFQN